MFLGEKRKITIRVFVNADQSYTSAHFASTPPRVLASNQLPGYCLISNILNLFIPLLPKNYHRTVDSLMREPRSDVSFCSTVVLRAYLQQSRQHFRMQERRGVRDQQEEPNRVQGVPVAQVSDSGHVEVGLTLRTPLELVQNPLPPPGTVPPGSDPSHQGPKVRVREGVRLPRRGEQ